MEQSITWFGLIWCAIPILVVCGIFLAWERKTGEVLIASARMIIQLVAIGYVLVIIFENPSLWYSLLVLCLMMCVAAWIAIRPVNYLKGVFLPALIAMGISVSFHLVISLFLVIDVDRWYEPRVLIPLAGMYFANSMNAVSLAVERYDSELHDGKIEPTARSTAFQAAMIPQINSLLAVGLVALPGMMTGQILSGVSPLIAVRYQILIMSTILGTSGVSSALVLWQIKNRGLKFDSN